MTPALTQGARVALQAAAYCNVQIQGEAGEVRVIAQERLTHFARMLLLNHRFELSRLLAEAGATPGSARTWTAEDTARLVREAP